jgi:hypothetical protein
MTLVVNERLRRQLGLEIVGAKQATLADKTKSTVKSGIGGRTSLEALTEMKKSVCCCDIIWMSDAKIMFRNI